MTDAELSESATPSRVARRQAQTRARLIEAATSLTSELGTSGVTIARITARADLGAGTFYNYFQSREEIIDAVVASAVESLGQRLDALTRDMADPAEIYAVSLRHLIRTAVTDPVFGWLMVHLGIAHEELLSTLGPRARRDLQKGIDSGRFLIPDLDTATAITFGALLSAIHGHLNTPDRNESGSTFAEYLLRLVGVEANEAHDVANRALPPLPESSEQHSPAPTGQRP